MTELGPYQLIPNTMVRKIQSPVLQQICKSQDITAWKKKKKEKKTRILLKNWNPIHASFITLLNLAPTAVFRFDNS